jgi:transposase
VGRKTFSPETMAKAVRLARLQVAGDDRSKTARQAAVAKQFGVTTETIGRWVRQAEIDEGLREGVPSAAAAEIAELRARNAELEQTIEILKAAAAFFAREYDPQPTRSADSSPKNGSGSESYRSAER